MQILIAEDNTISTKLLAYLLEPLGACEVVADGSEAVELTGFCLDEGSHFDLICLDIMMPNMDGHEALKRIRELEQKHGIGEDKRSKIILTTVVPQEDCKEEVALYDGYLGKPYSKEQLWDALKQVGIDPPEA